MAKTADEQANEDAIPEDVAAEATAGTDEEWEDIKTGLGRSWDLEGKDGPLQGLYLGINEVELTEDKWQKNDDGTIRKTAKAHSFGLQDGSGEIVFVWGSYQLDEALTEVGINDKVKLSFLGRESFSSDSGPRQIKRYRVQKAVKK